MMTAHLTKLASLMSVWILAHLQFAAVEQYARLNDTKESVFVLEACKAIHLSLAQRLAVNPMMTVPLTKNATFKHEIVNHCVSDHLVPLEQDVKPKITEKLALAITHCKATAIPHVYHVRLDIASIHFSSQYYEVKFFTFSI